MHLKKLIYFVLPNLVLFSFTTFAHADSQAGMDAFMQGQYENALNEWLPLAKQGDALAQTGMGFLYAEGLGVFQSFALMPWMTVFDNIAIAVRSAYPNWTKTQIAAHVNKFIQLVGLQDAERRRPAALSGGMKQRVGLARAFSIEPKVLLLDEPFAQIDALTRGTIQEELIQMWNTTRNTVFMVTHDVDEAILLSDRIMLMTNGPSSQIAEIVDVNIPRPRSRVTVIEDPTYYKIRNHIIHFLVRHSKQEETDKEHELQKPVQSEPLQVSF